MLLISYNSLYIGHSGVGRNPASFKLDPGLRRGDESDENASNIVTILGLLITPISLKVEF